MLTAVRLSVVMLSVVGPLSYYNPPLPVLFYLSVSDEVKKFDKIRHLSKTAMPQAIASIHLMRQDELRTEKGRRIAKNLEKGSGLTTGLPTLARSEIREPTAVCWMN
jgi:hypothetical protein